MSESENTDEAQTVADQVLAPVEEYGEELYEEVTERAEEFLRMGVPVDEVRNTLRGEVAEKLDIDESEMYSSGDGEVKDVSCSQIDPESSDVQEYDNVTITGKVLRSYDTSETDSKDQELVVGDETGVTRVTVWSGEQAVDVTAEEDEVYEFENFGVSEYKGRYHLSSQEDSTMEHLPDEEVEVPDNTTTFSGYVVSVQQKSGLVSRDEDGKVVEHTSGNAVEKDLRLKLVVDNGHTTKVAVLQQDLTEELTGITLEEAEEMAREAMDKTVVLQSMVDEVMLQYVTVEGQENEEYIFASDVTVGHDDVEVEDLVKR